MSLFPDGGIEARLRDAIDTAFAEHDSLAFQPDDATTHIADIIVKHVLPLIGDKLIEAEIASAKALLAVLEKRELCAESGSPDAESRRPIEFVFVDDGFVDFREQLAKNPKASNSVASAKNLGFESWWSIYPRRVGKGAAFKAHSKAIEIIRIRLRQGHTLPESRRAANEWLDDVTREFAASDKGKSGEFCPHPATWLNQQRYDDDTDTWYDSVPKPNPADPNGNGAAAMAYLQKRSGT